MLYESDTSILWNLVHFEITRVCDILPWVSSLVQTQISWGPPAKMNRTVKTMSDQIREQKERERADAAKLAVLTAEHEQLQSQPTEIL